MIELSLVVYLNWVRNGGKIVSTNLNYHCQPYSPTSLTIEFNPTIELPRSG